MLLALAEASSGYFTTAAAAQAGYSRALLSHHVRSGMLERAAQGVYRLAAYPRSPHGALFVAVLRVGPSAVISHTSALVLHGIVPAQGTAAEIDVTMPRTGSRRRPGLRLHTGRLEKKDVTVVEGVPVTTVLRTIVDVIRAGELSDREVVAAMQLAVQTRLVRHTGLVVHLRMRGGRAKRLVEQALC